MKKSLLILGMAIVAFGAQAEKAIIMADGAQVIYNAALPEGTVIVPMGWDAKNDGGSLVCNAGQLKWTAPSSFACRNGAIRWAKDKVATFTPTPGLTITKITVVSEDNPTKEASEQNDGKLGDAWTAERSKQTLVPTDGTAVVEMKAAKQNRMQWMEIEYTGTPTQVLPAVGTSFDLAQPGKITFASATEGATIHYTIDGTEPTAESPVAPNGVVELTADALVKTIAVKNGMASSYVYHQPVMVPAANSKILHFTFTRPSTIHSDNNGTIADITSSMFTTDKGAVYDGTANAQINVGPCNSAPELKEMVFVNQGAKMYLYGGNTTSPRYFISATLGCNYELRGYNFTTVNIEAPEGKVITDVMFNGADIQAQIVLGKSIYEDVDGTFKYVNYASTDEAVDGKLTQYPIYSKWNYHYTAPEGGVVKVQILSNGSTTKYLDNFFVCCADKEGSGVDSIEAGVVDENAPVEYYNLQGVRVENPSNGIFIKRQGAKATKVLVK
ncbi:MAG: chitobiase/beta-hexosaminidase C-terminal domain-containing protein [Muribaculaceae bacterium]|nr:chitobiase/beta-hexosaminidase C-terminal domain-containing protein [Muribaculaceae bacterium]